MNERAKAALRLKQLEPEVLEYQRLQSFIEMYDALENQCKPDRNKDVLAAVEDMIKDGPLTIAAIYKNLQRIGIKINGGKPYRNLSSMMSYSHRFQFLGRKTGWTIADQGKSENILKKVQKP